MNKEKQKKGGKDNFLSYREGMKMGTHTLYRGKSDHIRGKVYVKGENNLENY
jgi:hypothetical protein